MSRNVPLSDATIDAALERLARRVSADDLRDAILVGIARTPQARPPLVARPAWLHRPTPSGRLVQVVAVAGLLLAMLAGSLYVGSQIVESWRRHPAALVPTGVETLAPEAAGVRSVVADPAGILWAYGEGLLTRFDPASGDVRTWSYADDAAFGGSSHCVLKGYGGDLDALRPMFESGWCWVGYSRWAVPARGGGVWLVGDDALRWFDGERFRDVVPLPPGGSDADHHLAQAPDGSPWVGTNARLFHLAQAPDGSLWVGTDAGLFHWDGTAWSPAPAGRPAPGVSALAVDGNGVIWAGSYVPASENDTDRGLGLSRYDGTTWETVTESFVLTQNPTRIAVGPLIRSIDVAPDGSIWVRSDYGLGSYDGREWTARLAGTSGSGSFDAAMVTLGPDGAAWVGASGGCGTSGFKPNSVLVARSDGVAWTQYRTADGLPPTCSATMAATSRGVFAGTDAGVYRLTGDRWEPAWAQPGERPDATSVVAMSHDEAWAIDAARRLWHYADGAWSSGKPGEPGAAAPIVAAPGGGLVAATPDGIALLRDGSWTMATATPTRLIAVGADGTVRFAGPLGLAGPGEIGGFQLDDPGRALPAIPGPPLPAVDHLAVGPDGSIWAGGNAYTEGARSSTEIGLFRYRDGRWERVLADSLERPAQWGVTDLAVTPSGDVWVAWNRWPDLGVVGGALTRFDGATWTVLDATDGRAGVGRWDVAAAPDGAVWAATADGLARYDGTSWATVADVPFQGPLQGAPWSVAPDGTVFVAGPSGLARITDPGR